MLIHLYVHATRDELSLRNYLLIRDRTTWNGSIDVSRKHAKQDQNSSDILEHDFELVCPENSSQPEDRTAKMDIGGA